MVQEFLTQYWGIITVFLGGIIYIVTHYQVSVAYAKKKAILLMLAAEARSEELVLNAGQDKKTFVIDKGYDLLPSIIRVFVSKPLFSSIVQSLFDEAIAFAKAHEIVVPDTTIAKLS